MGQKRKKRLHHQKNNCEGHGLKTQANQKDKTKQNKITKTTLEDQTVMIQVLKLLGRKFKINMINMLRTLMNKIDSM